MKLFSAVRFASLSLLMILGTACGLLPRAAGTPLPTLTSVPVPTALPVPTGEPTQAPSPAPTDTPAPTATAVTPTVAAATAASPTEPAPTVAAPSAGGLPAPAPRRIIFAPGGTTALAQGTVTPNSFDRYVLRALGGQTLSATIAPPQAQVALVVFGADGVILLPVVNRAVTFSGKLPSTQDYYIDVVPMGNAPVNYTLTVVIPPLATAVPVDVPQRITFQPGSVSATIQGITATPGRDRFVLRALAGQTMTANISSAQGNVILIIYGADGNVLISDHAGATSWTGQLPTTQDYFIDTRSVANARVPFSLKVTIPPLATSVPPPPAVRITFPPGGTTAVVPGSLPVNVIARYVLRALAGQIMTVNVASPQTALLLSINGADGSVLKSSGAGSSNWTGPLPSTQDYFITISAANAVAANYTLQVTIPPK